MSRPAFVKKQSASTMSPNFLPARYQDVKNHDPLIVMHNAQIQAMPLMHVEARVEKSLGILKAYLLECVTRNEWNERNTYQMAQAIVTCLRHSDSASSNEANDRVPGLSRECLRRTVKFINNNLDSKLDWVQIATVVDLPPFFFGRNFKYTTGLTPRQYVIRCRIKRAMSLLTSGDQSIADIALEVGCSCQSHLTTLFRKHTGTTPAAFREASRGHHSVPMRFPASPACSSQLGSEVAPFV